MLIILKKDRKTFKVDNLALHEAHKPTVNGEPLHPDKDLHNNTFHYIESVLWFKTYMVSLVYIDCDKRDVLWYRYDEKYQKNYSFTEQDLVLGAPAGGHRVFEDIEIYDYDPIIDEMTDRANDNMTLLCTGKIDKHKFINEVVKIVHCYVLPSLRFSLQDYDNLVKAMKRVESCLEYTEQEILGKGRSVDLSTNSLEKQRHRLMNTENLHLETYVRCCEKKFLSFFLTHLEKEILNLESQLLLQQQTINKLRDTKTQEVADSEQLKQLRETRDKAHVKLQKFQIVRENIKNVTIRRSKLKNLKKYKVRQNVFHDIYRELSVKLQEQKEELQKLVLKKLKIVAVREAISHSIKDLQHSNTDSAITKKLRTTFTDGSEYSLDVHVVDQKPESWMTIDDKIKQALANTKSKVFYEHVNGISLIKEKIDAALSEMKQFGQNSQFRNSVGDNISLRVPSICSESEILSDDASIEDVELRVPDRPLEVRRHISVSDSIADEFAELSTSSLKLSLSDIVQNFQDHIGNMCQLIVDTISELESRQFNKVWISYENIFCEQVIGKLNELFMEVYKRPCLVLYHSLLKLSLSQFIIDDKFFKILMRQGFENLIESDDSSSIDKETVSSSSEENISDSQRSGTNSLERKFHAPDLYSMADQECIESPLEVLNTLDPSSFIDSSPRVSVDIKEAIPDSSEDLSESETLEKCYMEALDKLLSPAVDFIKLAIDAKPLLEKLRCLTKSFRYMNEQLVRLNNGEDSACCDDMLTITTALILNLNQDLFTNLYAMVNLLINLKAPFLSGGIHDYCLTNFFSSYQYLFDKQVLKRWEGSAATHC